MASFVASLSAVEKEDLAVSLATLIAHEAGAGISADVINAIIKAAGVSDVKVRACARARARGTPWPAAPRASECDQEHTRPPARSRTRPLSLSLARGAREPRRPAPRGGGAARFRGAPSPPRARPGRGPLALWISARLGGAAARALRPLPRRGAGKAPLHSSHAP
jgi:hypothetical protein